MQRYGKCIPTVWLIVAFHLLAQCLWGNRQDTGGYFSRDQIKEDGMGGACGMYWGKGELPTGFFKGNLKGDH